MQTATPTGEPGARALVIVGDLLRNAHRMSHDNTIQGHDSVGVLPTLMACDSFSVTARVPPVVPDTNVLRRDLGRSCKGGRTVLVNAANSGAVRLLCPAHVVVEMFEHAELFSSQMRLPVATYLQVWRRDYLPLLRVVDGLPSGMWTAGEEARISELERRDPDDVPAARLALAVGAYFVSTDGGPLEAVYGRPVDASIHDKWVTTLKSGGDAHELANVLEAGALLARLVGSAAAATPSPTSTAVLAVSGLLAAYATAGSPRRARMRAAAGAAGAVALGVLGSYMEATSAIAALAAPPPGRDDVASMPAEARAARACLVEFCRSPQPTLSASELRARLSRAGATANERTVRSILRAYPCFYQPHRGRFQLGRPAAALAELDT